MYNLTPTIAADWLAWLRLLEAKLGDIGVLESGHVGHVAGNEPPVHRSASTPTCAAGIHTPASIRIVDDCGPDLDVFWSSDRLLLSQTCGYPLTHALAGKVQLVATPEFDVPGCAGPDYSSVFVVRADDGAASLGDYRGRRAALNNPDSNSGMNVFRHAIAPLAEGGRFFSSVVTTGSHRASMEAVAHREADIASIDCVTFAFAREALPELASRLRVLGHSTATRGLPLITSRRLDFRALEHLRDVLDASASEDSALMRRLKIRSFARVPLADYDGIERIEREAVEFGYPVLA
jgi:ABC-type phosphate/phosphonate transport system substrate-binding protein